MALGFSMAFGAMFSKTWRVHKIFTNKKIQRMVMTSRCLASEEFGELSAVNNLSGAALIASDDLAEVFALAFRGQIIQ